MSIRYATLVLKRGDDSTGAHSGKRQTVVAKAVRSLSRSRAGTQYKANAAENRHSIIDMEVDCAAKTRCA